MNAKRIGVLAASLLFGLAVAGPVSYQTIPIIGSSGTPQVQIVIGSQAKPSDGVVAGNIAATIGSLSYTSQAITATPTGTSGVKCVVTTPACSITNQQVWLGESGVSAPSGTFTFTALIGSVLNRAIQLGQPGATKALSTAGAGYAYSWGYTTTNSPTDSPYTAAGGAPQPTTGLTASQNAGGIQVSTGGTFKATTNPGNADNILEITNAQYPALLNNYGAYHENGYLWLTGFPVYDQQNTGPTVQNFAILGAGGAYQVTFGTAIHEPYWTTEGAGFNTAAGTNSVNNAAIRLLGQNWTIVSYTLPGAGAGAEPAAPGTGAPGAPRGRGARPAAAPGCSHRG